MKGEGAGKLEAPDPLPVAITAKYYRPQVGKPGARGDARHDVYTEWVITDPRHIGNLLRASLAGLKLAEIEQIIDPAGTVLRDTTDTEKPHL